MACLTDITLSYVQRWTRHTVAGAGGKTLTTDAELGPVEPEPEEPDDLEDPDDDDLEDPEESEKAEKNWKIAFGCLIGVFAVLAAYNLISRGVGPSGGTSASGKTAPAVTHPSDASPSAASPSAAASIAAAPVAAAPTPTYREASPSPAASPAQRSLDVTSVTAFGPEGMSDGDHADIASRAIVGGAQPWYSSWYLSPEFGNLKAGTGLLLDMGKPVMVSSVQLNLGGQAGAAVQVRVGDTATLSDLSTVAAAADVGGTVRLPTATHAIGKYVLIWFTALPPIGEGKYRVSVYSTTVDGTAGT